MFAKVIATLTFAKVNATAKLHLIWQMTIKNFFRFFFHCSCHPFLLIRIDKCQGDKP
jgi:hypothetical protein